MSLTKQDLQDIRGVVVDAIGEALDTVVNPRFDRLESKVDNLEGRLDRLEGKVDHLESKVDRLEGKVDRLDVRVGTLEDGQAETNRRLDNIEGHLKALQEDIKELYALAGTPGKKLTELDKTFERLSTEDKIRFMHEHVAKLARTYGVKLPSPSA